MIVGGENRGERRNGKTRWPHTRQLALRHKPAPCPEKIDNAIRSELPIGKHEPSGFAATVELCSMDVGMDA
jgi:hypothetical protein